MLGIEILKNNKILRKKNSIFLHWGGYCVLGSDKKGLRIMDPQDWKSALFLLLLPYIIPAKELLI